MTTKRAIEILDRFNRCEACDTSDTSFTCQDCDEAFYIALQLLKEQQPKWIPVSEGMPEEHDSIFAELKGTDKWRSAMFEKSSDDVRIVEVFEDGTRRVYHSHTIDGKWDIENRPMKRTVTHWMPNPELPLEGR